MAKPHEQLRAYWSKRENDVMLHHPLGSGSKSDAHWLSGIFTDEFMSELQSRGYDPTTFRFKVDIDFSSPRAPEKFSTLHAQHSEASHEES